MSIKLQVDEELGIALLCCDGNVAPHDVQEVRSAVRAHHPNIPSALMDLRRAALAMMDWDVRSLAQAPPVFKRLAIFAPDPVAYGLARRYQTLAEGRHQVAVFTARRDAFVWLLADRQSSRGSQAFA